MANSQIRLATSSPGTQSTTKETLAQLRHIATRAAAQKADILLLPEAYLGGYPRGSDFGCKIGARTTEGRDEFLQYFKTAVDLGDTVGNGAGAGDAWVRRELGSTAATVHQTNGATDGKRESQAQRGDGTREELERIARETGVFIVVGLVEKTGGSLYCAVCYICPKLGIIGKRRKVQPTGTERLIWAQGSPATLKAVSTTIRGVRINLAAAICWENYMPLLRQALYAQNVNLYLAPTADARDSWLSLMRTVALEGRCFVVSSNMCVSNIGEKTKERADIHEGTNGGPRGFPGRRRSSCLTDDGFEIALPGVRAQARSKTGRRNSIFDEDGNEIVLCKGETSAAVVIEEEPEEEQGNAATSGAPQEKAAAIKPQGSKVKKLSDGNAGFLCRGGSSIISPSGDVLAGPQWEDDEGIIYADVDFEDCIRGRLDLDAAGSYSRNDSFKFSVEGLDLDPLPY